MNDKSNNSYYNFTLADVTTYQSGVVQSTAHRIIKRYTDDLLKEFGISTMQWFIIGTVYDEGSQGITVTNLAKKLGTGVPFLTNAVNLLESRAILERTSESKDSRVKTIRIHADFVEACPVIERTLRKKLRAILYKDISPEDLRTYIKVLHQLSELS